MNCNYVICVFLGVLFACNNPKSQKLASDVIPVDLSNAVEYKAIDVFNKIVVTPLETNDSSLLGRVTKIQVCNDYVYCSDRKQRALIWFNLDGKYINKLKKIGRGPDEFLSLSDFSVNKYNNTIDLTDDFVIRTYNQIGEMVGRIDMKTKYGLFAQKIARVSQDKIAFISSFVKDGGVIYSTSENKILNRQPICPEWYLSDQFLKSFGHFSISGDFVSVISNSSRRVLFVDENGYHPSYEFDFGKYNFDPESPAIQQMTQGEKSSSERRKIRNYFMENYAYLFQNYIESETYIIMTFMFESMPRALVYNKRHSKYILVKGKIGSLFNFSNIDFLDENTFVAVTPAGFALDYFSKDSIDVTSLKTLQGVSKEDNPVLLKLTLNDILFENEN